ncbi:MAG: acyltransferase [Pseudomonadales bacterium]|nr:acyltransferase [Pseudomonadales bacterium]
MFGALESLRGIAATVVVLVHSAFYMSEVTNGVIRNGELFVDFFFVLSGFVMAFAYEEKINNGMKFSKFIVLRFGRLYPLHLLMLMVWLPYIGVKAYLYHTSGIGSSDPLVDNNIFTFITNILLINSLGINDNASWNYPAWSISVEFYTYIIFFLYSVFVGKRIQIWSPFFICIGCYSALYFLCDDTLLVGADYGILRCCGGFYAGVFVYQMYKRVNIQLNAIAFSLIEVVVLIGCYYSISIADTKDNQLLSFLMFSVAVFLLAIQEKGIVSRALNNKPFRFIGKLSYSIYMTHAIVASVWALVYIYILKLPVQEIILPGGGSNKRIVSDYSLFINVALIVVVVVISIFTYKYIEEPWRKKFRSIAAKMD